MKTCRKGRRRAWRKVGITVTALVAPLAAQVAVAASPAFPGALGFGANAQGGRGGRVLVVDTTENAVDPDDGRLSLREALTIEEGPRYVVFDVGGVFDIGEEKLILSGEEDSYVTVACQSAPPPGVVIRGPGVNLQGGVHDVVMRHCRVRATDFGNAGRAVLVAGGGTRDILLDHMSLSWASDENFQVYLDDEQSEGMRRITLSNSIVAEGDADSSHPLSVEHPDWKYHSMGPSCNNSSGEHRLVGCSIVNNLIAHHSSRNAMIWGGSGEIVNNIVYDWFGVGMTVRPELGIPARVYIGNNLVKPGPDTDGSSPNPACGAPPFKCGLYVGGREDSDPAASSAYELADNWFVPAGGDVDDAIPLDAHAGRDDFATARVQRRTSSATSVRDLARRGSRHLRCVGASSPVRDAIDERIVEEFHAGTGRIGIGENVRGAEHDSVAQRDYTGYGAPSARPVDGDADRDGIADDWERRRGLDPDDPTDHGRDRNGNGYPDIEDYLNELARCDARASP